MSKLKDAEVIIGETVRIKFKTTHQKYIDYIDGLVDEFNKDSITLLLKFKGYVSLEKFNRNDITSIEYPGFDLYLNKKRQFLGTKNLYRIFCEIEKQKELE